MFNSDAGVNFGANVSHVFGHFQLPFFMSIYIFQIFLDVSGLEVLSIYFFLSISILIFIFIAKMALKCQNCIKKIVNND